MRLPVVEEARKNDWSFLQAVRNGAFTVPGDGDVDFDPVFKVLADAGYQGWLLVEAEQDPAKANPLEYAMKAREVHPGAYGTLIRKGDCVPPRPPPSPVTSVTGDAAQGG